MLGMHERRTMPLRRGLFNVDIEGGPYRARPLMAFGIKLATEQPGLFDVEVKIADFGVPSKADMKKAAKAALGKLLDGERVYAGCGAGIGRTGTFMAVLAKVCDPKADPVNYVRSYYLPTAVETSAQERFVAGLDVTDLREWLDQEIARRRLRLAWRYFWRKLAQGWETFIR